MIPSKALNQDQPSDASELTSQKQVSNAFCNVSKSMSFKQPKHEYDPGKMTLREFAAEAHLINKFGLNVIVENGEVRVEWSL